jgi:hypothetical protein
MAPSASISVWSAEPDTLPRVAPSASSRALLDVVLPVGISRPDGSAAVLTVDVAVDGEPRVVRIPPSPPERRYHEIIVPDVPRGAWLEYAFTVVDAGAVVARTRTLGMQAAVPPAGEATLDEDLVHLARLSLRRSIAGATPISSARPFLNAARWAHLAGRRQDPCTHVDEGWLLEDLPDRHWGGDVLPTVLMYNADVLLVLDRNGGRISHAFCRTGGRAFCLTGAGAGTDDAGSRAELRGAVADTALARHLPESTGGEQPRTGPVVPLEMNPFDEYQGAISGSDAFSFRYQEGTEPAPGMLSDTALAAIRARDRSARVAGTGTPVVWHDPAHVGFRKTIRLRNRTVWVGYEGVQPGHVVGNVLCVHLAAALEGAFHRRSPADDRRSVRLDGRDGVGLHLVLEENAAFTPETLLGVVPNQLAGRDPGPRVAMGNNLEVVCAAGGDFGYRLEL